jgi:hypothetical protein
MKNHQTLKESTPMTFGQKFLDMSPFEHARIDHSSPMNLTLVCFSVLNNLKLELPIDNSLHIHILNHLPIRLCLVIFYLGYENMHFFYFSI